MRRLAKQRKLRMIPEHVVFEPVLATLFRKPWPLDPEHILARQRNLIRVEIRRSRAAAAAQPDGAIMDRTLLSPIAYLYARTRTHGQGAELLRRFLDECAGPLSRGDILFPARIVLFSATPHEIVQRARAATCAGDARNTEAFLLLEQTLSLLSDFYARVAAGLPFHFDTQDAVEPNTNPSA
jgi:hypothetical protein